MPTIPYSTSANAISGQSQVQATTPTNQADDIIMVVGGANQTGAGRTLSIADGDLNSYTQLWNDDPINRTFAVWWRRSTSTATPLVTLTSAETFGVSIGIAVVRGCKTTSTPVNAINTSIPDGSSATTVTTVSITTTVDGCIVIRPGMNGGGTYRASNYTGIPATELYNDTNRYFSYGDQSSAGATGDATNAWNDAGSHTGRAIQIALEPGTATSAVHEDEWSLALTMNQGFSTAY